LTLLVYLAVNLAGMFVPLIENAAKYAQVSREICDSGNWLELTIAHAPYIEKPPLLFWIGALSFKLFGISDLAFRIPVLLISLAGIYSTYRLGKLLCSENTGKMAAFFWATCVGYLYFHSDIHTDTLLADFVIISIWQFAAFFREKKTSQFLVGTISLGLAMLTKGPFGLTLPVLAIATALAAGHKFREIFHPRWLVALLIILIFISPALYGLYKQFGTEGIRFFFWTNNVGRMTGSYRSSGNEPLFYLQNSLLVLFPWTIFVFAGIGLEIRRLYFKIKNRQPFSESGETLLLSGTLLFLIFLSAASQQNPHYMLPVIPLMMILAARWIVPVFEEKRFSRLKTAIILTNLIFSGMALIVVLILMIWAYPEKRLWFWLVFGAILGLLPFLLVRTKGLKKQLSTLMVFTAILFFSFNTSIYPSMLKYHSTFDACAIFNRHAGGQEKLYSYRVRHWSLFFYSKNYGEWLPEENGLNNLIARGTDWIYTDEYGLNNLIARGTDWIYTDEYGLNQLKLRNVKMEITNEFKHRTITGHTLKFMNPETREPELEKYYLVKLINATN